MYVPWSHRQRLAHSVAPQCCSECTPHWPVESPGPPLCSVAPPGPGGGRGEINTEPSNLDPQF